MVFSLGLAVSAGIVSFLSPCILPIIPGYLAYLAGVSGSETEGNRGQIFLNAVFFVLGFSFIFALLGVLLNTLLAAVAYDVQLWLARIGGLVIIFFGLYLTHLIHIPMLDVRRQVNVSPTRFPSRYVSSFVFGAAFAVGWTPCVGAVLGGILGLAASAPGSAFGLLLAYALGLGLPFLLVGAFTAEATTLIRRYANTLRYIEIIFGAVLIVLGILVFTQSLNRIASFGILNTLLLSN
ncbi:cytochrome C biogenesis protein [Candidatus Uhrbacteria bacterium CG10_big_fil_rev_8_21_14_0_10_48_11]|uniref:Cytochrome C biogenesis protein n=1 Tax=Candidatus Uhrbacteria bacterium CG10_big_fil_rev_8_21_14_0_10_48_11 TaxID=1975037 RepID=A0A2M8LFD0_9BACT|nr:MAG: cytochrome C biogenesis protein [Candidatus Uhrbacteria bacterium CG10_big_fil_rev_8_21_14_0_10_48_11]